jgi:hypothetical protein
MTKTGELWMKKALNWSQCTYGDFLDYKLYHFPSVLNQPIIRNGTVLRDDVAI